ncbi:Uncharacterised protein [Mycobacteroides abscessus subsp. abscessus]|nr:Uncharacterised protein [Mycobacteroides abscessus subsp. abscessus]
MCPVVSTGAVAAVMDILLESLTVFYGFSG